MKETHHRHHRHRHHKYGTGAHTKIHSGDLRRAAAVLALVLVLLAAVFYGILRWENSGEEKAEQTLVLERQGKIVYQGVTYRPKKSVDTYLLMGVDVEGPAKSNNSYTKGGQADVQLVVVVDHKAHTWQVLQLNRDSIVDVPIPAVTGQIVGYEREQISLAHSYGDGMERSCQNAVRAVSRLLYNADISGYAALNIEGLAPLNDGVGGVTVTVESDFSAVDATLVQGETLTLNGAQAISFVRSRRYVDDETNLSRMERHRQYLAGLKEKLETLDETELAQLYLSVSDYLVTNLESESFLALAEQMRNYKEKELLTIEGENQIIDGYAAYILDEDSRERTILELLYEPEFE